VVVLMCLTGAVIWWPGASRWRRSLTLHRKVHWRQFTWDLHNVLGFWTFALTLMWALSGIYFAFPKVFSAVGDFLVGRGAGSQSIDDVTDWLARLHFGRSFGFWIKLLWVLLGLVPAALMVTGTVMWWNRVLRRALHRSGGILEATSPGTATLSRIIDTTSSSLEDAGKANPNSL
jgi:uncharacterized iron-regulated membrane protein